MFGLGLNYGLGFSSDIRLRQDPQLRVSHLAATNLVILFAHRVLNGTTLHTEALKPFASVIA